MVTEYGKVLRKIRIDKGEILGDMAENLSISSAYLSSIETGVRKVPEDLTNQISKKYKLNQSTISKLKKAELANMKEIKVSFSSQTTTRRKEAALLFARTFNNLNDIDFERIREILTKMEDKK